MSNRNWGEADIARHLLRQGATRREAIGWLARAGMGMAAGATMMTRAGSAEAETPKRGGQIRVAGFSSSTADTVDPARQTLSTDYARCNMFYNGLTRLDESLTPQPELAESIENETATVWTFKLRKGVTFHDGKPLTADDVVYSLLRHKDPKVGSMAKTLAAQMQDVKATGPNEVQVDARVAERRPAGRAGHLPFPDRQGRHGGFHNGIGTGPYSCKEF